MFLKKIVHFRARKRRKIKYVTPEICLKGNSEVNRTALEQKISDRELALGYLFW